MYSELYLEVKKTINNENDLNDYHYYLDRLLDSIYDYDNITEVVIIYGIYYFKIKKNRFYLNFDFRNNKKPALIIKNRFKNILVLPSYPKYNDGYIINSNISNSSLSRVSFFVKKNILKIEEELIQNFNKYFDYKYNINFN